MRKSRKKATDLKFCYNTPMEKFDPTKNILNFYQKIGQRESLVNWRREVPADARRAWIKSLIIEVLDDKVGADFDLWVKLMLKHLPDSEKSAFATTLKRYRTVVADSSVPDLSDDEEEGLDEQGEIIESELSHYATDPIQQKVLYGFTETYFTTFETEPAKIQAHFERQTERALALHDTYIKFINSNPALLNELAKKEHLTFKIAAPPPTPAQPPEQYLAALVVYGSAAIGPRDTTRYGDGQDTDIMTIPNVGLKDDPYATYMESCTVLLGQLLTKARFETMGLDTMAWLQNNIPRLAELITSLKNQKESFDFHVSEWPNNAGLVGGWRRLVGPHVVVYTHGQNWRESYDYFLASAIKSARQS